MISIIIRTRNEEQYLERCLIALKNQNFSESEIILVDNGSIDDTVKIAKKYKCKIVDYPKSTKFNFSKAINIGIKNSKSEILSILSAHCVPFDNYWIYHAFKHFQDPEIGAVYSRQLPTDSSKNNDYRDLFQVFRSETVYQQKDFYFNNASSFIRKNLWKKFKFNETINSLEDLDWAKKIQENGNKIVYEPKSKVFHFHGINQNSDLKRLKRHVKIIKKKFRNEYN